LRTRYNIVTLITLPKTVRGTETVPLTSNSQTSRHQESTLSDVCSRYLSTSGRSKTRVAASSKSTCSGELIFSFDVVVIFARCQRQKMEVGRRIFFSYTLMTLRQ